MGVAKVANNYNDLVKGSLTRQKLQNSKGYAKSPEFSPALGKIIFAQLQFFLDDNYIYIQVKKKAFKINAKIEDVGLNED